MIRKAHRLRNVITRQLFRNVGYNDFRLEQGAAHEPATWQTRAIEQCGVDVGPPSTTSTQHRPHTGSMARVCWVADLTRDLNQPT